MFNTLPSVIIKHRAVGLYNNYWETFSNVLGCARGEQWRRWRTTTASRSYRTTRTTLLRGSGCRRRPAQRPSTARPPPPLTWASAAVVASCRTSESAASDGAPSTRPWLGVDIRATTPCRRNIDECAAPWSSWRRWWSSPACCSSASASRWRNTSTNSVRLRSCRCRPDTTGSSICFWETDTPAVFWS